MRESRLIIIFLIAISFLIGPIFYISNLVFPNLFDYTNVATNLYCGIVVGLITSACQYCTSKKKIKNNIYGAYFDVYRTYYYSKKKPFLWCYNSYSVYKKIVELNPKIIAELDEYYGFLKKYDKTYKKLNPTINLGDNYKAKSLIKSLVFPLNKNYFDRTYDPYIEEVIKILMNINGKRFEKDKEEMIRLYNHVWSKRTY